METRSLIGHYSTVKAALTRDRLALTLSAPANEIIEVRFNVPDREFQKMVHTLGIILQRELMIEGKANANQASQPIAGKPGSG